MNQLFSTRCFGSPLLAAGYWLLLYFAFSTLIMSALGRIQQIQGVAPMNSIKATTLHSLFMPFFFGTTLASLLLFIMGLIPRGQPGGRAMLGGGLIDIAGMFLCTMLFNMPLNNRWLSSIQQVQKPHWCGLVIEEIGPFGTLSGLFRLQPRPRFR